MTPDQELQISLPLGIVTRAETADRLARELADVLTRIRKEGGLVLLPDEDVEITIDQELVVEIHARRGENAADGVGMQVVTWDYEGQCWTTESAV